MLRLRPSLNWWRRRHSNWARVQSLVSLRRIELMAELNRA